MKIYHADMTAQALEAYRQVQPHKRLHALISYGRRNKNVRKLLSTHRLMLDGLILDSGTWTLNNNPEKYANLITLKGYKAYLRARSSAVDFYFNFDEDFSRDGFDTNFSNQVDLENAGFNPVPVVHDCYGDEIQTYIDRGHKMIAIGSGELKEAGQNDLYNIVNPLYQRGIKVHFLGCTQFRKLAYLPVYSADSTTWTITGRAGRIFYWNPCRSGYNKLDKIALDDSVPQHLAKHRINNYPFRGQLDEYLYQELRLSIDDLMGKNKFLNRELVNIHYFVMLEELIDAKHKEQGFRF